MKLFHISDLHLGKRVHEFSMIEDQKYILNQILDKADAELPRGILISGDVYDKAVPSIEAVQLLDWFLTELVRRKIVVFLIAGNHDSPQRLDFGSDLLQESGVHIAGTYDGKLKRYILTDEYGKVEIFLLPFIKPAMVSPYFEEEMDSYEKALTLVLQREQIDVEKRNLILAHQFFTWRGEAERSDSETLSLGGLDAVDASLLFSFEYAALGHLHGPQRLGRDTVRYAGSPLAYSFSEIRQKKGISVIELREKGNVSIQILPLLPLRGLREIKGPLAGLLEAGRQEGGSEDYIRAILTDKEQLNDPLGQLRSIYPNLMTLEREAWREREREKQEIQFDSLNPKELFQSFFEKQTDKPFSEGQAKTLEKVWKALEGAEI